MNASEMIAGKRYRLNTGTVIEFSHVGGTGLMIVHPPGEPDMQSTFAIKPTEQVEEVAEG